MLNRYNRSLKTLARKAGVTRRLTSYTPRHTWASVAYDQNVDLSVISKALGHTNTQTTLTYIKEISDNRLAEANHLIVGRI
jgi:integrase